MALLVLAMLAGRARADDDPTRPAYRAVVDRVELEPASITGLRLRVYLSALAIGGQLLDLSDPKSIKLFIGSSEKKYPYALGTYSATASETEIIVLVQVTSDFTEALPMIGDAIDRELLAHLSDKVKVAIVPFGDSTGMPKLVPVKQLRGKVSLSTDNSATDPALSDAVDRALIVLKKSSPTARKMIVVIADGRDSAADHDRVTRTAKRAAKEGVRIHAVAYSPADLRRPLLVLGELARWSLGTLRWPGQGHKPTADSWTDSFKQLADEIGRQYVLTYFAPLDDDVAGKKLHVVTVGRTETTSNEVRVPVAPECGGSACDGGTCADGACVKLGGGGGGHVVRWILIAVGAVIGAIVLLGLVGFLMSKRQTAPRAPAPQQATAAAPASAPPGLLPNGRPIPALIIMSGPRAGERLLLRHGFWIGKQPGCDLLIEDGYTSSQHAQIAMDANGACRLYDYNSTNGTFLNNVRVSDTPLDHGATIRIGSTELRFLAQ
jgi:hypothetical protein